MTRPDPAGLAYAAFILAGAATWLAGVGSDLAAGRIGWAVLDVIPIIGIVRGALFLIGLF